VKDAAGYQWSSHDDYVHGTNGLVDTDKVLRLFSERIGVARQKYMEFMTRGDSNTNPWPYAAYEQQIIGDERFVEQIEKRIENIEKMAKKIKIKKNTKTKKKKKREKKKKQQKKTRKRQKKKQ